MILLPGMIDMRHLITALLSSHLPPASRGLSADCNHRQDNTNRIIAISSDY